MLLGNYLQGRGVPPGPDMHRIRRTLHHQRGLLRSGDVQEHRLYDRF